MTSPAESNHDPDASTAAASAEAGVLYVVSTPIGNLGDITLRALRILGSVDVIAAEDTRHTRKLLTHHGISRPLLSYHDHNEVVQAPRLLALLQGGKSIALVTDAGDAGHCRSSLLSPAGAVTARYPYRAYPWTHGCPCRPRRIWLTHRAFCL